MQFSLNFWVNRRNLATWSVLHSVQYIEIQEADVDNSSSDSEHEEIAIDLFHNGGQIKCSFVLMLISLSSLVTTSKFQKNIYFKLRAIGLININTKECKFSRHL